MSDDDEAAALAARFLDYIDKRGSAAPTFSAAELRLVSLPAFMSAIYAGITEEAARLNPWVTAEDVEITRFRTLDGPTLASLNEHLTGCFRAWRCHQVESDVHATYSALIGKKAEIDGAKNRISKAATTLIDGIFHESTCPEFASNTVLADRIRVELCAEGHDLEAVVACLLAIQDIAPKVAKRKIQDREDWNKIHQGTHDKFSKVRNPETQLIESVGKTLARFHPKNESPVPTRFSTRSKDVADFGYSGPMIDLALYILRKMGHETTADIVGSLWKEQIRRLSH